MRCGRRWVMGLRGGLALAIVIAASSGSLALTPVTLSAPPDGDAVRAMWFYTTTTLFGSAGASQPVLDFCAREGVNRIYCGGYSIWASGTTTQKNNLAAFLQAARASGIRVEALLDGTDWQNNPALVQTRIDQILAFHARTPGDPSDDFDAIHFDIEFWLHSSWTGSESQKQQVARNYLDNVLVNARTHLNASGATGVDIATDLSSHFDTSGMLPSRMLYDGVNQYFLEHVLDHADDVVLMSYYDTATAIVSVSGPELDMAAGKSRRIQLGADIQPVPPELPVNSFADNAPTAYSAMTTTLESFHEQLSAQRLGALDGFSVFHYERYSASAPNPRNIADWDGDGDADATDYQSFRKYLLGPTAPATGLASDGDFNGDARVDLADFAWLAHCFTGSGVTGPIPGDCER